MSADIHSIICKNIILIACVMLVSLISLKKSGDSFVDKSLRSLERLLNAANSCCCGLLPALLVLFFKHKVISLFGDRLAMVFLILPIRRSGATFMVALFYEGSGALSPGFKSLL